MLFISTSGELGRYIQLAACVAIAAMSILTFVFSLLYCWFKRVSFRVEKKDRLVVGLSGLIMGVRWVTYFYAQQMSNVTIDMLSIFMYPVLTAFLEPIILKTKLQKTNLLFDAF